MHCEGLPLLLGILHHRPPLRFSACTSLPLSILLNPSSDTATSQQSEQTPALSCQSLVHYPLDSPFRIIGQDHQPTQERQARPTRPQEARRWTYFIRGSPTPSIIPVLPRWIFHSRLFFLFHPPDRCTTTLSCPQGCRGLRDLHPSIYPSCFVVFLSFSLPLFHRPPESCRAETTENAIDAQQQLRLVRMSTSFPKMASTERSSRPISAVILGTMLSYDRATTR